MSNLLEKPHRGRRRAALASLRSLQTDVQAIKREIAALKALAQNIPAEAGLAQNGTERLTLWETETVAERTARLIAVLDSFDTGDLEQQRQEFAELQIGLDAARPGQRSIFGEGFNP